MTFVLGITGGIASGKTTVGRMFLREGDVHINADDVVHDLFAHDTALIAQIAETFPKAALAGKIDRGALAAIVSNDRAALNRLEGIVHPAVRRTQTACIEKARVAQVPLVLLDVPLMFETGADLLCDKVVAVQATPALQVQRAMARPGMKEEKLHALMARQLSNEERARKADFVIRTDVPIADTRDAVEQVRATLGI
jgi:dephospho-CoA kinase